MRGHSEEPTAITFLNILKACSILPEGQHVFLIINDCGLESDLLIGNALIDMFYKCGSLDMAMRIFLKMRDRDAFTWTTMIAAHIHYRQTGQALEAFKKMIVGGVKPTIMTYATALSACSHPSILREGEEIHIYLVKVGIESDEILECSVLSMYGKCGLVSDACWIFDASSKLDVVIWNTMISIYFNQGCNEKALQLYQRMFLHCVKPNRVTGLSILAICASLSAWKEGMLIHFSIIDLGVTSDEVWNALLNMYGGCGSPSDAHCIFERMPKKNVVSWSSLIQMYVQNDLIDKAFQAFKSMQIEGVQPNRITLVNIVKACIDRFDLSTGQLIHTFIVEENFEPDIVCGNALITLYGNCGSPSDASCVFIFLSPPDEVSWTSVIAAHAHCGCKKDAIRFFTKMLRVGVALSDSTCVTMIEVLTRFTSLEEGKLVHFLAVEGETESNLTVANAFVNFYAKCGKLDEAFCMFDRISDPDVVSWSALITAHANQGKSDQAFNLLLRLESRGLKPDGVMFLCLLSACSHAGLIGEGFVFFHVMIGVFQISPLKEHWRCICDLLGRSGWLEQVGALINHMPYMPNFAVWMSFLSACRVHSHIEKGKHVAEHALELSASNPAGYVILSQLYETIELNQEADWLMEHYEGD
ncbi:hypothetical protein KP509_26G020400 [Ceratopteris richardii]|nr:hypothetical protein KP509_26G020400 [Ceratopteris richardii]